MLVLSRNVNQEIYIDDGKIIITILEIRPDRVRLGIQAPKEISVHRKEVFNAINDSGTKTLTQINQERKTNASKND